MAIYIARNVCSAFNNDSEDCDNVVRLIMGLLFFPVDYK